MEETTRFVVGKNVFEVEKVKSKVEKHGQFNCN